MDMGELLGALLKSQSGRKGGGGGGLGGLLEGLLAGGKKPAKPAPPAREAAPRHRGGHRPVDDVARDAYRRFETRDRGGARQEPPSELENERAKLLVLAMVNAAKSDGKLDKKEQDAILSRLGDVTKEEIDFLKREFAKPLDARGFAWDVPLGVEEQVYGFSVMSIDLDRNAEATYLRDLAKGLRLAPEECNEIHQRLNAPTIF